MRSNSNHTKILVDGIVLNQPGGTCDFANIPTDNVGRMELARGPCSSLYASDALSGVLQIFTRRGSGTPEDGFLQQSSEDSFPYRPGGPLIRRPKHAGVVLSWTDRNWTAQWSSRALGRRADSDFFAYNAAPNSLTSNPGIRSPMRLSHTNRLRAVTAFLRVGNVFNRKYQEVLGYLTLGRTFVLGTTIRAGGSR